MWRICRAMIRFVVVAGDVVTEPKPAQAKNWLLPQLYLLLTKCISGLLTRFGSVRSGSIPILYTLHITLHYNNGHGQQTTPAALVVHRESIGVQTRLDVAISLTGSLDHKSPAQRSSSSHLPPSPLPSLSNGSGTLMVPIMTQLSSP